MSERIVVAAASAGGWSTNSRVVENEKVRHEIGVKAQWELHSRLSAAAHRHRIKGNNTDNGSKWGN